MPLALCALSHSPLYGINDPGPETLAEVDAALDAMRGFVRTFAPDLAVIFGPDHYNGVFYDMMPAFCIGTAAAAVGDWGTQARALPVDAEAARRLTVATLEAGIDVAQSARLQVDHGIAQSMEFLFGADYTQPLVPVFVNAAGLPLGPMRRVRLLGEAIGREVAGWDRRVLLIASGGLSHDPPVPRLEGAPPEVAARLIDGRNPSPEARAARQRRVIEAGRAHASGDATHRAIAPEFDRQVLDTLAAGRLTDTDGWSNQWIEDTGGRSAHEIRAWLAAFAALAEAGPYRLVDRWYWPVKEWMTGFGMVTAVTDTAGRAA